MSIRPEVVEKILKYPTKKKLLYLLNAIVSLSMGKPVIDREDLNYLFGTLTAKEVELYEYYGGFSNQIREVMQYLNQLRLSIRNIYTHIFNISILAYTHVNIARSINLALEVVKDNELKDSMGEVIEKNLIIYEGFHRYDKEKKKIIVGTGTKSPTTEKIKYYQNEATDYIAIAKAGIDILRESMENYKFKLKAYTDLLAEIETEIKEPPAPFIIPSNVAHSVPFYKLSLINFFPNYGMIQRDETSYNDLKEKLIWKKK